MRRRHLEVTALACALLAAGSSRIAKSDDAPSRPNILWITSEDISPNLGSFGDTYAVTPHLDRLAAQGVRYRNAFAVIGVCAPARSTIITGVYPPSMGTHHMRCRGTLPDYVRCFTEYLRKAGYYCTNNSKEDYNFKTPKEAWDESSRKAHWRKRDEGQPFFSVFNFTSSHESQIRLPEKRYEERTKDFGPGERHDPELASIPPYHPDTPEVRRDWARYADMITYMDRQVGNILRQLEEDALVEDTIVFYYSDHGAGMPRSKRWLYDSSLRVPMIVRFPEKYRELAPARPGSLTDRLVSFVDLAPTVLGLAGVEIPDHMQGKAFLGAGSAEPRRYIHGFRDRMDERYDMQRAVRDERYKYIRNYQPHRTWAQHISYMYQMPTMKVWQHLADEGKLRGPEEIFFQEKPTEELYDTWADPHEVHNLAKDPEYEDVLGRLRNECRRWMEEIVDLGLLPESDLRSRFDGRPQHEVVRENPEIYPQARLLAAADVANRRDPEALPDLGKLLGDEDPAIRWWGAVGHAALGKKAEPATDTLEKALYDRSSAVRVAAAEALSNLGRHDVALPALAACLRDDNEWVRLAAANVLDHLDEEARPVIDALRDARDDKNNYVRRVIQTALEEIEDKRREE